MSYSPYNFGNPMSQQPPSGNVYLVNSFNEAANVPQGFGTTVNLCLNDNIMYMRNNNAPFLGISHSYDYGRTWTEFRQTDIPNANRSLSNEFDS